MNHFSVSGAEEEKKEEVAIHHGVNVESLSPASTSSDSMTLPTGSGSKLLATPAVRRLCSENKVNTLVILFRGICILCITTTLLNEPDLAKN